MKFKILMGCLLSSTLVACATVDYQSYEGNDKVYLGSGGTKVISNDVEFWANGEPNKKYKILGIAVSEIGSGIADEALIRSAISKEVKKHGGDAAIQLSSNERATGTMKLSPTLSTVLNTKQIKFAIIKYIYD